MGGKRSKESDHSYATTTRYFFNLVHLTANSLLGYAPFYPISKPLFPLCNTIIIRMLFYLRYNTEEEQGNIKDTYYAESKLMDLFQKEFLSLLGAFQYVYVLFTISFSNSSFNLFTY